MSTIGARTGVGNRPHRVTLQNPGPPAPDGDGGFIQTWTDLEPEAVWARIEPATVSGLERVAVGTVISTASHVVTMPYHAQVTTETRILFNGRRFNVTGVANPDERNVETIAICAELVS